MKLLKCQLTIFTNHTFMLPSVTLNITNHCNSRCLMCDFWKNRNAADITLSTIEKVADSAGKLNINIFVLSGGEPLLHPDIKIIARMLRETGAKLCLITNGVLLEEYASLVADFFSKVYISLDGGASEIYRKVRGIEAFSNVFEGVKTIKRIDPSIKVIGRAVIQKSNYFDLVSIIKAAKDMGMNHISFLAADVQPSVFGRDGELGQEIIKDILLDENDLGRFKTILYGLKKTHPHFLSSKFIIGGFKNLLNIYDYYRAIIENSGFPKVCCDLPWISSVIEVDGEVRPCHFHKGVGNIQQEPLEDIVNSIKMIEFRKNIRKMKHPKCVHCVCKGALRMPYLPLA